MNASSVDDALRFAEAYAPEHLLLAVGDPDVLLPRIRNAGSIFLGPAASVSFGDYMTGANHVLPTGSLARSYSGLSTQDFIRWTTYQRVSPVAAARLAAMSRRSPSPKVWRRTRMQRGRGELLRDRLR